MRSKDWSISKDMYVQNEVSTWDIQFSPLRNETLLSWYCRIAKSNAADPVLLYQLMINSENSPIQIIKHQGARSKLINLILSSTSGLEDSALDDLLFCNDFDNSVNFGTELNIKYCRYCLMEDEIPYFRRNWQYLSIEICLSHNTILECLCPHCFEFVTFWKSSITHSLDICWKCEKLITESKIEPIKVTSDIVRIQKILYIFYISGELPLQIPSWAIAKFPSEFSRIGKKMLKLDDISYGEKIKRLNQQQKLELVTRIFEYIESNPKILTSIYCENCQGEFQSDTVFNNHECILSSTMKEIKDLYIKQLGRNKDPVITAEFRYQLVKMLIQKGTTAKSVKEVADQLEIAASTIWNWIKRYRENQTISSLLPQYKGKKSPYSTELMNGYLNAISEREECQSIKGIYEIHTQKLLEEEKGGIKLPSYATVRRYYQRKKKLFMDQNHSN